MASNPIQCIFFIKFIRYEVRQESSSEKQSFSLQFLALKDEFILNSTAGTGLLCTKYLAVN